MRVAFVHPDLGIGGAERLVVDAAVGLQHDVVPACRVHVYTSHHDPAHCFPETRGGRAAAVKVTVLGDFLPRHLFGRRFHALCAAARSSWLCLCLLLAQLKCWMHLRIYGQRVCKSIDVSTPKQHNCCYDAFIVDQVSAGVPILRLTGAFVLFYCHFPDKLLAPKAPPASSVSLFSALRAAYRKPLDFLEESSVMSAHSVMVNSNFTRSVFMSEFKKAESPRVVYPGINIDTSADNEDNEREEPNTDTARDKCLEKMLLLDQENHVLPRIVLSVSRFERKKQLSRALYALKYLLSNLSESGASNGGSEVPGKKTSPVILILAGGYDHRLLECSEVVSELTTLCKKLCLPCTLLSPESTISQDEFECTKVLLLPSISQKLKSILLKHAQALVYTPSQEHFGIVPVEAMLAGVPVVAMADGGPAETVRHGKTGYLCRSEHEIGNGLRWALELDPVTRKNVSQDAKELVKSKFSRQCMAKAIFEEINSHVKSKKTD